MKEWPRRIEGEEQPKKEGEVKEPSPKEKLLAEARQRYGNFAERFERTINAYFGTPDMHFTMKPGGWYVDLKNIVVNADPTFFLERGYTESESLFATFHEAQHFLDMIRDPDAYEQMFERVHAETDIHDAYPKALQRLYNCLDDVLVNRSVMSRWKAGRTAKDTLYPKLFPNADLRTIEAPLPRPQPRHRQFMYALLRKHMLPNEKIVVDEDVQNALNAIEDRGKGRQQLTDMLTSVDANGQGSLDPETRFLFVQQKIEPIFAELFKKDLQDRQAPEKNNQGPFGEDPLEGVIPDPIDFADISEAVKKIKEAIEKKKKDEFKNAMGVEKKDFDAYQKDFETVKPYIEELSKTFNEIIDRRKSYRRVLRKSVKEGVMLDPKKIATGVAEIRSGNMEPRIMLDFEQKESIENLPTEIEFTLVCDGSGSMQSETKTRMQRRLAVLATEALASFRERVEKERRRGEKIELKVKNEVRLFHEADVRVKALNDSLTHIDRVQMHKQLTQLPGGGNNEPATFQAIDAEQMTEERRAKLADGRLKKIILFLTDGQTDTPAVQGEIQKLMRKAGTDKHDQSHLVIAGIGFEDGTDAVATYAPNGFYAKKLEDVPVIFKEFLKQILADV